MLPRLALLLLMMPLAVAACTRGEADVSSEPGSERMEMMDSQRSGGMRGGMMDSMMGGESMGDMATIHGLLANHRNIDRRVHNVPGGVRTVTVSDDPQVAALIRKHVREMRTRYERDQPIRMMDPVFRELFRHRHEATMRIEDVPGGVRVVHTSDKPKVVALIRQHARGFVSEAAEQGMRRAMRPTPLPSGYGQENTARGAAE